MTYRSKTVQIPCPRCGKRRPLKVPAESTAGYGDETTRICQSCTGRFGRALLAEKWAEVDDVVVERLVCGRHRMPLSATPAERQKAVMILTRRGLTSPDIARTMSVTTRTVDRIRARVRAGESR